MSDQSDPIRLDDLRFRRSPMPAAGLQISRLSLPKPLAETVQVGRHRIRHALAPGRSPMRLFEQTCLIFVRVPKNASNSLMSVLYPGVAPATLPHYSAEYYRRVFPRAFRVMPSFAPLRHPLDRFASAFTYYRFTSQKPEERQLMDNDLPFLKTLEDFVHWLNDQPDLSAVRILRWHHFHRQTAYICDARGRVIVDLLFPVEEMGPGLQALSGVLGRVPEVGRLNMSRAHGSDGLPMGRIRTYYQDDIALWEIVMAQKVRASSKFPAVQMV